MNRSTLMTACGAMLVAGAVVLAGCAGNNQKEDESYCKSFKGTPTTVNKMCVVMSDDPVDPAVKPVVWKGTEYGLCCNGCRPKWEAMSPAQRDAAVARVVGATH